MDKGPEITILRWPVHSVANCEQICHGIEYGPQIAIGGLGSQNQIMLGKVSPIWPSGMVLSNTHMYIKAL